MSSSNGTKETNEPDGTKVSLRRQKFGGVMPGPFAVYLIVSIVLLAILGYVLWVTKIVSAPCEAADISGENALDSCQKNVDPDQDPDRFRIETMVTAAGALALVGAGYFTWRRSRALEGQVEVQRRQVDELINQGEQAKREHETERYGRAIEQLGSERIEIRTGGLFALEALAVDDDSAGKQRWGGVIYEILVAYLREHTRVSTDVMSSVVRTGSPLRVGSDVEALLRILSRRRVLFDCRVEALAEDTKLQFTDGGHSAPTSGVHLVGQDFAGANLTGANFRGATFDDTNLRGAHLWYTDFRGATFDDTIFREAMLFGTNFRDATLTGVKFDGATLNSVKFDGATLNSVKFDGATLNGVKFDGATLDDATLNGITTDGARLTDTELPSRDDRVVPPSGEEE